MTALFWVAAPPSYSRPKAPIVCIDPGHPSENGWGARSKDGVWEVDLAWEIAGRMKVLLEAAGIRVRLTKQSRYERVTNRDRAEIANRSGVSLFLRLHCDAPSGAHGFTLYYPDRKGRYGRHSGPPGWVQKESRLAAHSLHHEIRRQLSPHLASRGIKTDAVTWRGRRHGVLTASAYARVPTVLVEMVSLGYPKDVAFIRRPEGKAKVARALSSGVIAYLKR